MSDKVSVAVLVENTAVGPGIIAEHGLAYWIQHGDRSILFDTGQGNALVGNAWRLGIRLEDAGAVVLSHGHYDHTGGLPDALRGDRPVDLFLHPAALERKFACDAAGSARDVGIPYASKQAAEKKSVHPQWTEEPTPITERLTATGPVPRVTEFEDTGGAFFLDQSCTNPDDLIDDQSLFFESREGVVILLGCAHSGVVNTMRYVRELTGGRPIHAVLGGMHLVQASPERLAETIEEFKRLEVPLIAPCHCTGDAAVAAFRAAFPDRCAACHVTSRFDFDL
ncbi:MAG: MBL fold metallo-hydrolase [Pirellulales bacterium]|nr:MBL fold metallo-hydrolase [Pirellulales bacterium]